MEKILKYPAISISKGQLLHFARSPDDLTTCSATGFKSGYYNNLKIIDSSGIQFLVHNAEKIGTVGVFWVFSLLMGQRLRVKLHFASNENEISLQQFKDLLLNALERDKYFWSADGEFKNRKVYIQTSKSHNDIITHLTKTFFKVY